MSVVHLAKYVVGTHKGRLAVTYIVFSLEMLGSLLRPYFLGEAVNDLQEGTFKGLVTLLAVHAAWMSIGTVRQMYDTRTYTAIYKDIVLRFMRTHGGTKDVSVLSARSTLARDFTEFLEFDIVYIVEAGYNILGSLFMLYFYEPSVLTICAAVLIPVLFVSRLYGRAMERITRQRNDELERQVDVITSRDEALIEDHYAKLGGWQIRLSDIQARNFGFMEVTVMIVLGSALVLSHQQTGGEGLWAGDIVGIYSYILKFLSGLDTIPYAVEKVATLRDIVRRLDIELEESSAPGSTSA
ncbi:MAG: ABC transporter six-transmembrane domain-containing protein [Candidatus Kapaibacterium sp.]